MKTARIVLFLAVCLAPVVTIGVVTEPAPRVLKVSFDPKVEKYTAQVNREPAMKGQPSGFIALLKGLSLGGKDIVLLEYGTNYSSIPESVTKGMYSLCESNKVAIYLCPADRIDVFRVTVYHWITPYETPLDLSSASFFLEGKLLGRGKQGFVTMVGDIKEHRSRDALVVGCHVKDERLSGLAVPFHEHLGLLNDVYSGGYLMDMTQFK
jgi:hypothetical protein